VDRMLREFKVGANVGRPQVSYRETIKGTAQDVEGRFVRQTGGAGQYGIVYIDVEPAPGEGFDFVNKIKGGSIPTEFIPAVEKGGNAQVVSPYVPLAEMFGYATDLRSTTQGRATYTMQFERYDEVPANIVEKVVGELQPA